MKATIQTQGRQFTVKEDGQASAVIAVPRPAARTWLQGSGCGGCFLRPLWSDSTSAELQRNCFRLQWLRGQRSAAEKVWGALREVQGVVGLVADGKDVAVRTVPGLDTAALQAQIRWALQDDKVSLRAAVPGQRWWRLGPRQRSGGRRRSSLLWGCSQ